MNLEHINWAFGHNVSHMLNLPLDDKLLADRDFAFYIFVP